MGKQEPKIIAPGYSDEELFCWLEQKLACIRQLQQLNEDKASLEARLKGIGGHIERVSQQSRIEIFQQDLDSIPHQCNQ